ncbi:hypothetical protein CJ030_MR5G012387 [Morella rubra]|uniref:TRF2/HOY1 PH-like domain-containing protein n=1 Tax=Morella rubra TaxID=262757 RepID=A0A6A1VLW8_9ROSI|nr:hypothetical protein CJ030_MR5G012387 [Morella rubra]
MPRRTPADTREVIEDGLVAKFYYLRKQIVWEIMKEGSNRKIEIEWSDVIGIKAATREGQPGILGIKLDKPPKFYKEIDPQPRKHPTWNDIPDFTNGEALINRMHYVTFPPGVLDKHYEKLLQSDSQLSMLSQMSFPSQSFLYFESDPQIHDPAITLQNFYDEGGVTWLIPDSQIHHAAITPQNYNELTPYIGVQSFISNPAITLQNYTMAAGPRVRSYISNPAITPQNHTMEAPYVDGVPSLFPDSEVSQLHDQ